MYKNPLKKYQQGGQAPSQDQQKKLKDAFIKWLPKRVKEFKDAQPEQIEQALNELSKSQEGAKQIETWTQQFLQEVQGGVFAKGGKLHNFICNHAHGGYIQGCGCGSNVPKGENGMPGGINSKNNPSYRKTDIGTAIVEDSNDISRIIWNPRSERPDTMIRTGRNMPALVSPYDEWYRRYRINAAPEDIAEKSVWNEINARIDKAKEIYNSTQKKQEGGELDRWPGFEMVRDTVISTPRHNPYRERIIANGRGDAARQRIYGNDTTSVGGYFSDGQFMPNGDIMYRHPELDAKMQELINQKRANSTIAKHQAGGNFSRAATYYNRHSNADQIRKIQNFLVGRGYNVGDLDGIFGSKTYEAIRQYQRDMGLKDDGMWGEDTNQYHRVLQYDNSTFSGPRSGAHPGKHTYTPKFKGFRFDDGGEYFSYSDINNVITRAMQDPEWFWGDSDDAKRWRVLFEKGTPDGNGGRNYGAILKDIYNETPDEIRSRIDPRKLSQGYKYESYNQGIRDYTTKAAPIVAATLAAPVMASEAIGNVPALAGSIAGSYLGADQGRRVGRDLSHPIYDKNGKIVGYQNVNNFTQTEWNGNQTPVVSPDHEREGAVIGGYIGGVAGGMAGDFVGNTKFGYDPTYNPTNQQYQLPRLRGRKIDPNTGQPYPTKPRGPKIDPVTGLPIKRKPSTRLFSRNNFLRSRSTGRIVNDKDAHVLNQYVEE